MPDEKISRRAFVRCASRAGLLLLPSTGFAVVSQRALARQSSSVAAALTAPRLSGPAPFVTMLDALDSSCLATANPLKDLLHQFDFGDPGTGNWAIEGVAATAKNAYVGGPLVPHCWETPGVYTVTDTVENRNTNDTDTATLQITVTDPNLVWPGANTICVSLTGNYTGAPAGSTNQTKLPTAAQYTGKRVLLHKGESFGAISIPQNTLNSYIGAYGTGADPIVASLTIGPAAPESGVSQWPENIVFTGLNITGDVIHRITGKRLTSHRNHYRAIVWSDALDFYVDRIGTYPLLTQNPQEFYCSHDVAESALTGGAHNISTAVSSYLGYVGCDYGIANQHTMRMYRWNKFGLRACAVRGQSAPEGGGFSIRQSLKAHSGGAVAYNNSISVTGKAWGSMWGVVGGCLFGDEDDLGQYTVSFSPQNNESDERVENVIIENSIFREGPNCVREINFAGKNLIERGNVREAGGALRSGTSGPGALPDGYMEHYFLS